MNEQPKRHTFLDTPEEIGVSDAAMPEFLRYVGEGDQQMALETIADNHMQHLRRMAALPSIQNSIGGVFMTPVEGAALMVVDSMMPFLDDGKRIVIIMTPGEAMDSTAKLISESGLSEILRDGGTDLIQ